jgi:hypothetical protein
VPIGTFSNENEDWPVPGSDALRMSEPSDTLIRLTVAPGRPVVPESNTSTMSLPVSARGGLGRNVIVITPRSLTSPAATVTNSDASAWSKRVRLTKYWPGGSCSIVNVPLAAVLAVKNRSSRRTVMPTPSRLPLTSLLTNPVMVPVVRMSEKSTSVALPASVTSRDWLT